MKKKSLNHDDYTERFGSDIKTPVKYAAHNLADDWGC